MTQTRNLLLELGANFISIVNFKVGYNTVSSITNIKNTANKLFTEYTVNANNIYNKFAFAL